MASDKKKTSTSSSGNGGSVPPTKRPGRTIDLEVEDVTVEDVPAKETSQGAEKKVQATSDSETEKPDEDGASSAAKASSSASEQRTKPVEIKRFITHLAAGLAGGLVAVVGAGIVYDPPPVTVEPVKPYNDARLVKRLNIIEMELAALPRDNTPLKERLSAVETKLAALPKSDPASDVREAAGKLDVRVTALENKPLAEQPDLKDFTTRLGKLEGVLNILQEAGAQEGASGVEQSAMLTGRIDEISTQLDERIGEFKKDMAALQKTLEARVKGQARESGKVASDLTDRLGAFVEKIASLEKKMSGAVAGSAPSIGPSEGSAAVALAFVSLRRAAERGHPYADQLAALKNITPDGLDLTELEANSVTGIATKAELLSALPGVLKTAHAAIPTTADETFLDRVVTNARSVVRIRRISPSEGDNPGQVLSRMEAQMKILNLEGILREAEGLEGGVLDVVKPWIDKAKARRASEELLDKLGQHLLGALQTNTQENR